MIIILLFSTIFTGRIYFIICVPYYFFVSQSLSVPSEVPKEWTSKKRLKVRPFKKMAVLVRMHGGAFRWGSGGPKDCADYFMDEKVVLVTLHYRLGVLGFLSTEDSVIPGNFGLKDQSMALRWVKNNIGAFGGDPEEITVFGESAGGASAHYHMISPLSKDILKGAISESGVVSELWGLKARGQTLPLTKRLAKIVGCTHKNSTRLLTCLQTVSAYNLMNAEYEFRYWDMEPIVIFVPVREPPGEGAFLPFEPLSQRTTIPWMTGVNSGEGAFRAAPLWSKNVEHLAHQYLENMDEYIAREIEQSLTNPKAKESVEEIKIKYFSEPRTTESVINGVKGIFADFSMGFTMERAMKRHQGPLYQYYYDYRAGSSLTDTFVHHNLGVCHADELLLLFNFKEYYPETNPDEERMSKLMIKFWTNFAKFQKPTLDGDEVQWPRFNSSKGLYLHIKRNSTIGHHLQHDSNFWWSQLPIFH